jgi:hypothetical protein
LIYSPSRHSLYCNFPFFFFQVWEGNTFSECFNNLYPYFF